MSHRLALPSDQDDDDVLPGSVEFGRRLRASRRRRGLSQRTAAELVGLSQGFLSMVENGKRRLNRHRDIIALAELLEVDPRSFSEE
ncbi:helix-turn-helix domain-containing protein [Actinophytocola sediminis]